MTWAPNVSLRRQWAARSPGKLAAPIAFAMALLFGAAAQAQQFDYSAVLASQGRINGPVNAGGIVWQCNAKYCTTRGPWPVPGVKSCNALATIVGPLASYGYKGRMLSPSDMASCNGNQTATAYPAPANSQPLPGQQPKPANQSAAAINPLGALFQNLANANNGKNSSNGGSSGSSTPPANSTPPPGTSASSSSAPGPLTIRTAAFTVTGTGALPAPVAFTPTRIRTAGFHVTGTGALPTATRFTPAVIRTPRFVITGTGAH